MSSIMCLWKVLLSAIVLGSVVAQRNNAPTFSMTRSTGENIMNRSIVPLLPGFSPSAMRSRFGGNRFRRQQTPPIFFIQNQGGNENTNHRAESFNPETFNPNRGSEKNTNIPLSSDNTVFNVAHSTSVGTDNGIGTSNGDGQIFFPSEQQPSTFTDGGRTPSKPQTISDRGAGSDTVSQPNNSPNLSRKTFRTEAKPSCAGSDNNFPCETDDEYDEAMIAKMEQVLRDSQLNAVLENDVVSQLINVTENVREKDIEGRFGVPSPRTGLITETAACLASETIIYPQRAKTYADDWVFVVNQNMVRQGVKVEKCRREGSACELGGGLPPTVKTVCRQKFIYRKLLVLSNEGTDILPESVLIPSCCVCYVSRFNDVINPRRKPINSTETADNQDILNHSNNQEQPGEIINNQEQPDESINNQEQANPGAIDAGEAIPIVFNGRK